MDERDPSRDWVVEIGQPQARDMQLVGAGRVMVSHHHGFSEFEIETGRLLKEYAELEGVTAARRQPDGSTLLAGVNLMGGQGVHVLSLDDRERLRDLVTFPGNYVRLIRQTAAGTYLMSCNQMIREGAPDGRYLRDYPVEGFYHAWKAVRRPDGHLLISAGYGAFLVELDESGREVRRWGGPGGLPESFRPLFFAMFQCLPNGNIVLANWQGHGEDHGASGVQLIEFAPGGEVVWTWSRAERISSMQGILVLDDLDIRKLHDEREGLMVPMGAPQDASHPLRLAS